jgi:hypothetical protein
MKFFERCVVESLLVAFVGGEGSVDHRKDATEGRGVFAGESFGSEDLIGECAERGAESLEVGWGDVARDEGARASFGVGSSETLGGDAEEFDR